MADRLSDPIGRLMGLRYKSHPWHGVFIGKDAPEVVTAFIEVVPTDTVKYEIDKDSGYLRLDRPQKYSNVIPALYGFIPQTFCGDGVGAFCSERTGRPGIIGDGDPCDICVLTEKDLTHGDLLVSARAIGGFRMIDGNQAVRTPKATNIPKTCTGGIGVSASERKPTIVVAEVNSIGRKSVLIECSIVAALCLYRP